MRQIQISLLLCVVVFATGCPKYRPDASFKDDPNKLVTKINNYIDGKRADYEAALRKDPSDANNAAKGIRNELIENALPYLDASYMDFVTDIQAGRDRQNYLMDLVELGASAAVGITNGERSLQVIGVALTAFRGGRRSYDVNFYKDQSTPILISKMDGNRAKVRATILSREKNGVADYQLGAAVGDLVDYYNAGTLVRAFTELQKDTAIKTNESEEKVLELKGVAITREATKPQRDLSVEASNILTALKADLNSTDEQIKADATTRLQNIVKALEKDTTIATVLKAGGVSSSDPDGLSLRKNLIAVKSAAADANNTSVIDKINQAIVDTAH